VGISETAVRITPLHALHLELGAKTAPFAGYDMPIQYPDGIMREHLHTRAAAGLFDVSHMGQARIVGSNAVSALERLVPGDIAGLKPGRVRYTLFTNASGGVLDDLMVTNAGEHLSLVVNAARKDHDFALLRDRLGSDIRLEILEDAALVALQGPSAAATLVRFVANIDTLPFMAWTKAEFRGLPVEITRSGYTGEDGYEISCRASDAEFIARTLLAEPEVAPIGLGARDSLRLEAGLSLYGHELDETTTPVEAALEWTLPKRRRAEGGFPGADMILKQLTDGATRRRVGIVPEGRAPARDGATITAPDGRTIGVVTSGGFGPTLGGPVAMGYVETAFAAPDTPLLLIVRGKPLPARVRPLPLVPARYYRGTAA